ncbi:MAG: CBS domain-containing protein [Desulfobacterales bacterium]|jgi:CBS domain-containing protein
MYTAIDLLEEKRREMVIISADRPVLEALKIMVKHNIGAIVVEKNGQIAGIWTERDFMRNSLLPDFDPALTPVGDLMTRKLYAAAHDTPLNRLQEMYLGLFVRHIFIEKNDRYIGLLSIGDVLRANLIEKDRRIRELNEIVSWDYYEDWKWEKRNR